MEPVDPTLYVTRVEQAAFAAGLRPAETSHTIRVWQVAPIHEAWTAVVPVRAGQEAAARRVVDEWLASVRGVDGGPPRNCVGLLERQAGRRGMRYSPGERRTWPEAALYLEFMPAGSDMVYAHYGLAYRVLEAAAPLLEDARWYAIVSQCEDILDRWEIVDGCLRFERLITEDDCARTLLELIEPGVSGVRG